MTQPKPETIIKRLGQRLQDLQLFCDKKKTELENVSEALETANKDMLDLQNKYNSLKSIDDIAQNERMIFIERSQRLEGEVASWKKACVQITEKFSGLNKKNAKLGSQLFEANTKLADVARLKSVIDSLLPTNSVKIAVSKLQVRHLNQIRWFACGMLNSAAEVTGIYHGHISTLDSVADLLEKQIAAFETK